MLLALALAAALSACGGSSSDASKLLKETFSGPHTVNSGNLSLTLTLTPASSTTGGSPIALSFGGPFQSQGQGKLPKSDFNISLSARGSQGHLSIISTGTAGYVSLQGASYQLPASTFQKLESSFSGLATTQGGSGQTLSKLGIHPLDWLRDPKVVGSDSVGGAATTHIRATINVPVLLSDLDTFLRRASASASQIPSGISAATRVRIANEIENPTFDVWTGKQDKTIRRLSIALTVSLGSALAQVVGAGRAQVGFTLQYADLNQPQTVSPPTNVQPFSRFQSSLRSLLAGVQSGVSGLSGASSSSTGTGTTSTTGTSTSSSGGTTPLARYTQCISAAHGDVGKMQSCASLINGH